MLIRIIRGMNDETYGVEKIPFDSSFVEKYLSESSMSLTNSSDSEYINVQKENVHDQSVATSQCQKYR